MNDENHTCIEIYISRCSTLGSLGMHGQQHMGTRVLALALLYAVGSAAPPRFGKPRFDATSGSWVVNVSAP